MGIRIPDLKRIYYTVRSNKKASRIILLILLLIVLAFLAVSYLVYFLITKLYGQVSSSAPDLLSSLKNVSANWTAIETFIAEKIGFVTSILNQFN
ncbi:MAG: hypothetical protein WCJ57_03845 [Candidatus Falkowbacteria bacterium]